MEGSYKPMGGDAYLGKKKEKTFLGNVADTSDRLKFELIALAVGAVLGYLATRSLDDGGAQLGLTILFSMVLASAVGHIRNQYTQQYELEQIHEISSELDSLLRERTERLVEHVAIGTENGNFEAALDKLHGKIGNTHWIIAKFISKKLDKDFAGGGGSNAFVIEKVGAEEYSKFQASLIRECSDSIYMTSPHTPKDWLAALPGKTPHHMEAFVESRALDKAWVCNLTSNQWREMIADKKFFEQFCSLSVGDGSELFFVNVEVMQRDRSLPPDQISFRDYTLFDRKLVMSWTPDDPEDLTKGGQLLLLFDQLCDYLKLFLERTEYADVYYFTAKDRDRWFAQEVK